MNRSIGPRFRRARTPVYRLRQPWRWLPFRLRLLFARLRSQWVHRRLARRILLTSATAVAVFVFAGASARAQQIQERWGTTVEVVVATEAIEVGNDVSADGFHLESRPVAFVASDALRSIPDQVESFVRPIESGEVISERDLRSSRSGLMPPESRAVSVPLDPLVPSIQVGDSIELILVSDTFAGVRQQPDVRTAGIVLELDEHAATVAVPSGDVAALAHALVSGQVVVARQ